MSDEKNKKIQIRVSDEDYFILKRICEKRSLNMSALIRKAILEYLYSSYKRDLYDIHKLYNEMYR